MSKINANTIMDFFNENRLVGFAIICYIIRFILFSSALGHKKKNLKDTTIQSLAIAGGAFEAMIILIVLYLVYEGDKFKSSPLFILICIGICYAVRTGMFSYIATYTQPDCMDTSKYNTNELVTACQTDNSEDKSILSLSITIGVFEVLIIFLIWVFREKIKATSGFVVKV